MIRPPLPKPPPGRTIKEGGGGFVNTLTAVMFIILIFAMGFFTAILSICRECL